MTGTLHLPRGLPASGKTTFARRMLDAAAPGSMVRLNRDDLRAMALPAGYVRPTYDVEQVVSVVQQAAIGDLLRRGVDVIVDDTNLRVKFARDLDRIAAGVSAETLVHDEFLAVPVDECIARDRARGEQGGRSVGAEIIRGMHDRYLSGGRFLPPLVREAAVVGKPYIPVPGTPRAVIVDIDGTVALHAGIRDPYDTSRYHEDAGNEPVIEQVHLARAAGYSIVFCSGRSAEFRDVTEAWIERVLGLGRGGCALFMRPAGDLRNDAVVKLELFDQHIRDHFDVRFVLDDRDRVVAAWRSIGLTVFQVAPGNF